MQVGTQPAGQGSFRDPGCPGLQADMLGTGSQGGHLSQASGAGGGRLIWRGRKAATVSSGQRSPSLSGTVVVNCYLQTSPTHRASSSPRVWLGSEAGSAGGFPVGLGSLPCPPWAEGFADLAWNRSHPRNSAGPAGPAWLVRTVCHGPTGCQAHRRCARARGSTQALERAGSPHAATPVNVSHGLVQIRGDREAHPSGRRCCKVPPQKVQVVGVCIRFATGAQGVTRRCQRGGALLPLHLPDDAWPQRARLSLVLTGSSQALRGGLSSKARALHWLTGSEAETRRPGRRLPRQGGFSGWFSSSWVLLSLAHSRLAVLALQAAVRGSRRGDVQLRGSGSPQGRFGSGPAAERADREGRWGLFSHSLLLPRPRPVRATAGLATASVSPCQQQSGRMQ